MVLLAFVQILLSQILCNSVLLLGITLGSCDCCPFSGGDSGAVGLLFSVAYIVCVKGVGDLVCGIFYVSF